MSARVLFASRRRDVVTIDAVVADDMAGEALGPQVGGFPLALVGRLSSAVDWVDEAAATTVAVWAASGALVDVALKHGPSGPWLQLTSDRARVSLVLTDGA